MARLFYGKEPILLWKHQVLDGFFKKKIYLTVSQAIDDKFHSSKAPVELCLLNHIYFKISCNHSAQRKIRVAQNVDESVDRQSIVFLRFAGEPKR